MNSDKTSYIPKPVRDAEVLNERSKSVGLPPIEDYIKGMNEKWYGIFKK